MNTDLEQLDALIADLEPASEAVELARPQSAESEPERKLQMLASIEAALGRMDRGSFGYCVECGTQIDIERLKANPVVSHCLDCEEVGDPVHQGCCSKASDPSD
ncbi:MAG: TraR/DksA family transcriptional regulator [Pseudomonadota bacterium]